MKEEWNILQILRHSRHDWLNFVQLIKGNLALKKYERVEEIIQEIIDQTQHESKLSNLEIPNFAGRLLVFNWEKDNHFLLETEVFGPTQSLAVFEESLVQWFDEFTIILNRSCKPFGENHLLLSIELSEEELPRLTVDFHGEVTEEEYLKKYIEKGQIQNEQLQRVESYISKEEFIVSFILTS